MRYHTLNGIKPKSRFEELLPFAIPELSDESLYIPREKIKKIFPTYIGDQVPTLDHQQYATWLQDLHLNKLSDKEKKEFASLIQKNQETMITPFQTLPHWYQKRLQVVQEILKRDPNDAGHISPSWQACTSSEFPILIRKLLGATGYAGEFSEAEYEESVPLIEEIIKFVSNVEWQVAKKYASKSSEEQNVSIKTRLEQRAIGYADEIAMLINEMGFQVSDFPSLYEDRDTLREQLKQLMNFKMVYAENAGSEDVEKLLRNLPT